MDAEIKTAKIVPDIIKKPPQSALKVVYGGRTLEPGARLTVQEVSRPPAVSWDADQGAFYTLVMSDPDAPSASNPKMKEWLHWLVVNVPGDKVGQGEVVAEYAGATPPPGSGPHRYALLVFKQPSKITFKEKKIEKGSNAGRAKFDTMGFIQKYKMDDPAFGNYFLTETSK